MSESCQRDCNEAEVFSKETLRVEADVREWMGRDATVATLVCAIQDSGRLLAGLEMQARTGLDQEVRRTRDQKVQMEGTITGAKLQAKRVEAMMTGVEIYAQMKELEQKVSRGRQRLEKRRRQSGEAGSKEFLLREDRKNWELVKKSVLGIAKAWKGRELATKDVAEEAEALEELQRNLAKMREEQAAAHQEEMRRRTEKEGWARLDKVSSEVGRMEGLLGYGTIQQGGSMELERVSREASSVERCLGEKRIKDNTDRDEHIKVGKAGLVRASGDDCSQVQRSGMVASGNGNIFGFSSSSTSSLSNYVPPTPRYVNCRVKTNIEVQPYFSCIFCSSRTLGVQLKLGTSMLKKSPSINQVVAVLLLLLHVNK